MTLDDIEKLLAEATPGPWEYDQTRGVYTHGKKTIDHYSENSNTGMTADATLIAAAPTIIRQLLDVARAAKDTWSVYQKFCEIYDPEEKKPINWHKIWALMQEHANAYGALQIRLHALESSPKVVVVASESIPPNEVHFVSPNLKDGKVEIVGKIVGIESPKVSE